MPATSSPWTMTTDRVFALAGTLLAGIAVAGGAFGAHALRQRLSAELLAIFETGIRYQMYHGLALLAVALLLPRLQAPQVTWAGWAFIGGVLVFSGSLYALALTGTRTWGAVTPIGGVLFLTGWICLGWGILRG